MTTITNPFMHFEVIKDYRQAAKVEHHGTVRACYLRTFLSDFGIKFLEIG
ncbi:hypothetical protein VCSRO180_3662 [Vibrio cholerae]|nr:hypothetical protein [Vibrio cholerae]GIA54229.1 hypothetical protein VCSRO180_3662 [Vibrio cholerae]